MVTNIILAAFASVCQLVNAYLGGKFAGKVLTPKQQRFYDWTFLILGFTGILLVCIIAYRGNRQERAHFSLELQNTSQNILPDGKIVPYSWFIVNQPLSFNVFKTNVGSGSAYKVDSRARSFLEPDMSISSQRQAINEFTTWLKSQPPNPGETMAKGDKNFTTASGNILSPEDVGNLIADRRIPYILSRILFEDDFGSHTVEYCHFLAPQPRMPPGFPSPVGVVEVWGECDEYNAEK